MRAVLTAKRANATAPCPAAAVPEVKMATKGGAVKPDPPAHAIKFFQQHMDSIN